MSATGFQRRRRELGVKDGVKPEPVKEVPKPEKAEDKKEVDVGDKSDK